MEDKTYTVTLKCIFCGSTQFEFDENKPPKEGEMIKCDNCGQLNDFSAIKNLCVNKKVEGIKEEYISEIKNMFKKFGK